MSETNPFEMKPEFQQYEQELDPFWSRTSEYGGGYNVMEKAVGRGWRHVESWGNTGYEFGSMPYVMVFFGIAKGVFYLIHFIEHDVVKYACPSREVRNQVMNEIAFMHWKNTGESFVQAYTSVDQLPAELRCGYGQLPEEN